ncbi:FAD-binding oxidoreductase [Elioraea sp.]|uniref:NAD(P)/FAD-dependent oxidoreductase n=1 Tax=Elioraea sp. TaxID=2185103 RepID=UPI0025BE5105|nr:FAD-dependent oxidoreductase [Elioraea sp.]
MTDNRNEMPPSLWAATAPAPPETAALAGGASADICVIGAGYTGLSAALTAAEAGAKVVVIEAAAIGWGASGRNNGQVIPTLSRMDPDEIAASGGAKGEEFVGLIRDSASLVFDLIRKHDMDAEAVQNGWIQPAHRESRMAVAAKRVEAWGKRGAPVSLLDRAAMARLTGTDHWHGGWTNRSGGRINPLGYARGLARAAISAGATIFTHTPAEAIARDGAKWVVTTPNGRVVADRVIIATNAYSTDLWPGFREEVIPVRSYQMATAPLTDNVRKSVLPEGHALSDTRGDLYFFRFDANGRLITGGALALGFDWENRIRERIGRRVAAVYPQVGVPKFDYVWWGYIGATADKAPHVHELAPGVTGWNGCNGRGVALATAIGRELGRQATGTPWSDIPLPLSPVRPIPAYGFAKRIAPAAILDRRWRDGRD